MKSQIKLDCTIKSDVDGILWMPIKWRLAAIMADRELDYKDLAKLTGFNKNTVSRHKNLRVMPRRLEDETLLKYCEVLNCQPGDLLVYIPENKK